MVKNTLENYKAAIKAKYAVEKTGIYSSFLLHPSRAKLRKLCAELFLNHPSPDDLKCFSAFFQFDFTPHISNKLKEQTDKFRPIETFFKGETDLTDIEAVNIAALLVDYQPRPYLKFSKQEVFNTENSLLVPAPPEERVVVTETIKTDYTVSSSDIVEEQLPLEHKKSVFSQKRGLVPVLILVAIVSGFGYLLMPKKECMQWQKDHYEAVVCDTKALEVADLYSTLPLNKSMLDFRKIQVCDTTTFFKCNKPIVWYSKTKKKLDFFNAPGFHPENGKPLKPITQYMINKYIKPAQK
jgi:hypothetical protein